MALAVQHRLTVDQVANTITVYPSMSGSIAEAARRLHSVDRSRTQSEGSLAPGSTAGGAIRPSSTQRRLRFSEADLRSLRIRGTATATSTIRISRLVKARLDDVAVPARTSAVSMRSV